MTDTTTPARITDDQEIDAIRVLRSSYWESVLDIAENITLDIVRVHDLTAGDIDYLVAEHVDGSRWIIYTWRARLVRSLSDHADAYAEYGFSNHASAAAADLEEIVNRAACLAMQADVHDAIGRITATAADQAEADAKTTHKESTR